jgi:hypothetical protein
MVGVCVEFKYAIEAAGSCIKRLRNGFFDRLSLQAEKDGRLKLPLIFNIRRELKRPGDEPGLWSLLLSLALKRLYQSP